MTSTPAGPGLHTDRYELTMLAAALADGTAGQPAVFEVFTRSLPKNRGYGVVAGTARLLDAITEFTFADDELAWLEAQGAIDARTRAYLTRWRFPGTIRGYREGELYFPFSPVLTVEGTFGDCVLLETLVLSILNHDSAIASAAARMVTAAEGRTLIEMGSRRTHEEAAIAAARAAYVAGFAATSNLAAGFAYGIPTVGTSAHAFTLAHHEEADAFTAQVDQLGKDTTLLVDTYDIPDGIRHAVAAAGPDLGGIRIDSGVLGEEARHARAQLDALGATGTRIVITGDLDEYVIADLADDPVDTYGVGTRLVTGSGHPTAGFVYKLVATADGQDELLRPVAKRSSGKASIGGRKLAYRELDDAGHACDEHVVIRSTDVGLIEPGRALQVAMVERGVRGHAPTLAEIRAHHRAVKAELVHLDLSLTALAPAFNAEPTD